ncbi:MAG: type II toxin-antitoxin system MqsR family toxin [Bacteroidales bacterium]|nr:type II toxin-antitoxin system MqsR family toxin [Bacteroidales bacterium]MBP5382058.1 type II toxin-antitoxin system MqsR family toxin [Bacteroidales bacterium]
MIKPREDVERFLAQFFPKFEVFGILFLDREKNLEALKMLGITAAERKEIIRTIDVDDYVETIASALHNIGDLWVFGKDYENEELYIKIALGRPGSNTICVSFHKAEHTIRYAYREGNNC